METLIILLVLVGAGSLIWRVWSFFVLRNHAYRTGRIDGQRGNSQNNYYAREWMRKAYTRGWVKGMGI